MDPVKIKLRKPIRVILDYGHTELELKGDSNLCYMIEKIIMTVKDEEVFKKLEDNNLILEKLTK